MSYRWAAAVSFWATAGIGLLILCSLDLLLVQLCLQLVLFLLELLVVFFQRGNFLRQLLLLLVVRL